MKLTEQTLKELILEELQKTQVVVPAEQADEAEDVLYQAKVPTYESYPSASGLYHIFVVMGEDQAKYAIDELEAEGIDVEY